ncbi:MAG: glycoside hydrolase family 18 protein [Planctomycetaceae bacterium]
MRRDTQKSRAISNLRLAWPLISAMICFGGLVIVDRVRATRPSRGNVTFRVVGYLPDYRLATFDAKPCQHLTDLIVFSIEPQSDGALNQRSLSTREWKRFSAIAKQHGISLHVCVGGWGRSNHFSTMVQSPVARRTFIENIVGFSQRHGLAGIDLDWEHPKGPREQAAYELLLTELSAATRPHRLVLSIAAAGWQTFSARAFQTVDRVHLMSYDAPQRHATTEQARQDIDRFLKMGCPKKKLCLGLPFYGRHIQKRTAMTYAEIVETHHPRPEVDELQGVYFNGPSTIRTKTRMAITGKLAGVCVWEIGQDTHDASSLLLSIVAARRDAASP